MSARTLWIAVAMLSMLSSLPTPAIAQAVSEKSVAVARAPDNDAAPTPESGAPDPLAPQQKDEPAPQAPGAPAPAAAAPTPAVETDPVVASVRQRLGDLKAPRYPGARDDLAAAVDYYAEASQPLWIGKDGLTPRARQATAEIAKSDDWGLKASEFELPAESEGALADDARSEVEIKLSLAVLKYARYARGGRLDPSSVSRKFDQKPVVFDPKSVLAAVAASPEADAYLRGLHPKHPQFERLRQALLTARKAKAETAPGEGGGGTANKGEAKSPASIAQLLSNMERWRWMPPELGRFYVWDSIPEQTTSVIEDGKVLMSEKIVVGKLSSPTPIFSADMLFVIFHPSWGVPPGMKQHELLPKLQDTGGGWFSSKPLASAVLKAHGLRATRGGAPVDPDAVDWSKVDISSFHFEQPPGPTNVLGSVKFRFPNRHDVYMHDTPERHLFGGAVRAFSHGCMRVQNPMHLAEVLLAHDKGWSPGEVKDAQRRGGEIKLSTPIPVHVTYFTVTVDDDGKLQTRPDLYGLDSRTIAALGEREERIAETGSLGRERGRTKRASLAAANAEASVSALSSPDQPAARRKPKKPQKVVNAPKQPSTLFEALFGN